MEDSACGHFLEDSLLVRKWTLLTADVIEDPVFQLVLPTKWRQAVLKVAHDESGHSGVAKTYDCVLRHFCWPRLRRDVAAYIKTCHTCQLTGKPNQVLKPAPLYPIPALSQPFDHLIIDCVGPLPRSKSGSLYLLTVMSKHSLSCCLSPAYHFNEVSGTGALNLFPFLVSQGSFSLIGVPISRPVCFFRF